MCHKLRHLSYISTLCGQDTLLCNLVVENYPSIMCITPLYTWMPGLIPLFLFLINNLFFSLFQCFCFCTCFLCKYLCLGKFFVLYIWVLLEVLIRVYHLHNLTKNRVFSKVVKEAVEELDKILGFNSLLISLKNHPDADRFALGLGPVSLLGRYFNWTFCFDVYQSRLKLSFGHSKSLSWY